MPQEEKMQDPGTRQAEARRGTATRQALESLLGERDPLCRLHRQYRFVLELRCSLLTPHYYVSSLPALRHWMDRSFLCVCLLCVLSCFFNSTGVGSQPRDGRASATGRRGEDAISRTELCATRLPVLARSKDCSSVFNTKSSWCPSPPPAKWVRSKVHPKPHGVLSQLLGQNLSREARFLISSPSSEWFPMSLYGFHFQTKRGTFESQKKRDIWAEGAATPRLCMGRVAWRCSLPKSVGSLCLGTRAHNSALRSACGPLRC